MEGRTLARTMRLPARPCHSVGLPQSDNLSSLVSGSDPFIHVKGYDAGWIQLVCWSMGWFPKPWTEWRDAQGRVLLSLSETHSLDETGLFRTAVSSRVRDSTLGNVSCTVRNEVLGQEKTTAMVIGGNAGVQLSLSFLRSLEETLPCGDLMKNFQGKGDGSVVGVSETHMLHRHTCKTNTHTCTNFKLSFSVFCSINYSSKNVYCKK